MSGHIEPRNKSELIRQIREEHEILARILASLSTEQILELGASGELSVKDLVAHLTAWEIRLADWLTAIVRGNPPDGPKNWAEIHRWNAEAYQRDKEKSLPLVLEQDRQIHQAILELVQNLSEEQLQTVYTEHWPRGPLWRGIALETAWHTQDHCEEIRQKYRID